MKSTTHSNWDIGGNADAVGARALYLNVLGKVDGLIGTLIEVPVALLVVTEVIILFAGVVSRYMFHHPLVWSDELASILFLWLAMLGAVVASRRGEHMRMTALVNVASDKWRAFFDVVALCAALAFLLLIMMPSYEYAAEEAFITTPALEIMNSWRAAALPVGVALMGIIALVRLLQHSDIRLVLISVAAVMGVCVGLSLLRPILMDLGNINLLIFFVGIVGVSVLAGIPIAFCFGLATFGYLALTTNTPMMVVVGRMDEGMSQLILLAVPLFVFLGLLIEMTGMARAMVQFLASLLGHVRGGLSYALIGAMYLVSGISGSKAADMAAIVPVLFPEMEKRGANRGELVALLSATGAQTETIPPSLVLIVLGSVTGVSISALFTGGLLPAVVLGIMLCTMVWLRHRSEDLSGIQAMKTDQILRLCIVALPALILPFIIRAAVIEGVTTATEVSTIGIAYSVIVGIVIYRQFDWRRLRPMLVDTASLSGAILLIIGAATGMAWALTQSGFSHSLGIFMAELPGGRYTFLGVSIVLFIILGSVLEGIPAVVLFAPLMFPIAGQMGVNEVHYAMVTVLAMGLGLFSPPFGVGYYVACAISRINPDEGMRHIWGYLFVLFIGLAIVALFPWLSIWFM